MNDQPKPTTGEWTVAKLASYIDRDGRLNDGRLLDDINAERESYIELCDKANGDMIALNKQLAVLTRENDGRDQAEADYASRMVAEIQARDKQLAAEIKYREQVRNSLNKIIEHLNDQLAAEREKRELAEQLFHQRDKEMQDNLAIGVALETERNELREQLAVANSQVENADTNLEQVRMCYKKQLTAEQEKVQNLERFICNLRKHYPSMKFPPELSGHP